METIKFVAINDIVCGTNFLMGMLLVVFNFGCISRCIITPYLFLF